VIRKTSFRGPFRPASPSDAVNKAGRRVELSRSGIDEENGNSRPKKEVPKQSHKSLEWDGVNSVTSVFLRGSVISSPDEKQLFLRSPGRQQAIFGERVRGVLIKRLPILEPFPAVSSV